MAAEALYQSGQRDLCVDLYDAMPSLGRKFLMAGKGGLNLTHSEPQERFLSRYGQRQYQLSSYLRQFGPDELIAWAHGLGVTTFVGSSGRVFPQEMKAAPLLRAWLHRLRNLGLRIHVRHRWQGWHHDSLVFATPAGEIRIEADAVILALGGGSWPQLGSDGRWMPLLAARGVPLAPLRPANCGFDVDWSEHFRSSYAGQPVKTVTARLAGEPGRQGEFVVTATGVEGSLIYAFSAALRDQIDNCGEALLYLDLAPDWDEQRITQELVRPRGSRSFSSYLQSRIGMRGVKAALLRECLEGVETRGASSLAGLIKNLPLRLKATRPLDEAISSAGGVCFAGLDEELMLLELPGVFCAGEMLDWEAPTGGYLLTACMASGRQAGLAAAAWLASRHD
jgi:uncharacterized flavoprotein (TIGR03862 family)